MSTKYDHTEYERARIQAILLEMLSLNIHTGAPSGLYSESLAAHLCRTFKVSDRWIANMSENIVVSSGGDHRSWGGTKAGLPYVEVNLSGAIHYAEQGRFEEYASIAEDPSIGNAIVHTEDQAIMLLLAHELAHALHSDLERRQAATDRKPHGEQWKRIYGEIRDVTNKYLAICSESIVDATLTKAEKRLHSKVLKLKAMAEHESSNENEAERAQNQLSVLLDRLGKDMSEITEDPSSLSIVQRFYPLTPIPKAGRGRNVSSILFSVSKLTETMGLNHTRYAGGIGEKVEFFSFTGTRQDVELAMFFAEQADRQLRQDFEAYQQTSAYKETKAKTQAKTDFLKAYIDSACRTINAQHQANLRARRVAERQAAKSNFAADLKGQYDMFNETESPKTQSLVEQNETKQDRIDGARRNLYPKLRSGRAKASRTPTNPNAVAAGRSKGQSMSLNKPVSGASGPAGIGMDR